MAKARMILRLVGASAAISLIAACAQEGSADGEEAIEEGVVDAATHMQLTASENLQEAMKDSFSPEQVTLLESAAHQFVISQTCDGFELDTDKAKAELAKMHQDKEGKDLDLSADEKTALTNKVQMGFGMAIGSQMTISGYDTQAFCDHAREETPENPDEEPGYILTAAAGGGTSDAESEG